MFEGVGTGPGEKTLEDKFFECEVRHKPGGGRLLLLLLLRWPTDTGRVGLVCWRELCGHEMCPVLHFLVPQPLLLCHRRN
jgi:hypothetical protein